MVSWFLGFVVSWFLGLFSFWFLGCLIYWFLGFLVSKFLGFKVSKIYKMSISCFLEDIAPISKISKNLVDGSPGIVGTCLLAFSKRTIYETVILTKRSFLKMVWELPWIFRGILGSQKINHIGFGAQ